MLDALIGVKNKYVPETFFRFERMIWPYPGQKPKTGELAGESGGCIEEADRL